MFKKWLAVLVLCGLTAMFGFAEELKVPLSVETNPMLSNQSTMVVSARSALNNGLANLSQSIAERILNNPNLSQSKEVKLILIDSLLAQNKFDNAEKLLADFDGDDSPKLYLRRAILALVRGKYDNAANFISKCQVATLNKPEVSWYFLCRGLMSKVAKDFNRAKDFFEKAKENGVNDLIKTIAQSYIYECGIENAKDEESLVEIKDALSGKYKIFMNTEEGFAMAKQYALALYSLGKKDEAINVLNEQLDLPLIPENTLDDLSILLAIMQSANPEIQRNSLLSIINRTSSISTLEVALYLYKKSSTDKQSTIKTLNETIKNSSCPLKDRILLECAYLNLDEENYKEAGKNAEELLKLYPASRYALNAYGVLAWNAFSPYNDAPEYRLAAKFLNSMLALEKSEKKSAMIKLMIADCYYFDKDYELAILAYKNLYSNEQLKAQKGLMLYRILDSLIKTSKIQEASELLKNSIADKTISAEDLWTTQWNLISAYRESGKSDLALDILENFINNLDSKTNNEILNIRMLWAKATLNFEIGHYNECVLLCNNVLSKTENLSEENMDLRILIASNSMLLKAKALNMLGKLDGENGAYTILENLRQIFPKTSAASASYITQANILAKEENYLRAAALCEELFAQNKSSEYAANALYKAAQYYIKTGQESSYKSALKLLDLLCINYPDNPLAFYARILQCETMRLLNAFNEAKNLYQDLINKYPTHPDIDTAKLGLGDTYLAQQNKEGEAALCYERLYSSPSADIDIRAEAAFKLGFSLERIGKIKEAQEIWWIASNDILNLMKDAKASGKSKYWVGRMLLYLARSFESNNDKSGARKVYNLIISNKLPGNGEAKIRLEKSN